MSEAANTNTRPLGINAFAAVRAMPAMDTGDLQALLAGAAGHLSEKLGAHHTAKVMGNVLNAVHQTSAPMSLHEVAFYVAAKHGVSVADLTIPHGEEGAMRWDVSHPRQEAYWLASKQRRSDDKRRHSLPQIGRFFGGRDHSTVIFGIRAHEKRMASEATA